MGREGVGAAQRFSYETETIYSAAEKKILLGLAVI